MKKILTTLLTCLCTALCMPAQGQQITQQQTFGAFINGLPPANLPLQSTDKLYVLQNGASKSVAGSTLGGGGGSTPCVTTPASLQYNNGGILGCVSGAISNGSTLTLANGALIMTGSSGGTTVINSANTSSTLAVTLPATTANLAFQVGTLVNGNCIKASGTVGGVTDSGISCGAGGSGITIGTTAISSGTTGRVLFDNAAVAGEYAAVPVGFGGTGSTVAFTQGSVVFAGAAGVYSQDNSNFFYSATAGPSSTPTLQVGPRGSSPIDATLEVYNPGPSSGTVHIQNAGTQSPTGGAIVSITSIPAGTAIVSGSRLGALQFGGAVDTSQTQGFGARINAVATENWGPTAVGSKLTFSTIPNTTTTATLALTLDQNQTATFTANVTAPTATLGTASSATGQLILFNSGSANSTTLQAGAAAASRVYTWPTNFGSAGTTLTDAAGNGTLSWAAVASSVSNSDGTLTISPTTGVVVASIALGHSNTWTATQTFTPSIIVGTASSVTGQISLLNSSNSNTTKLQAGAATASVTYTLPLNSGGPGSTLTDVAGNATLSWSSFTIASAIAMGYGGI